MCLAIPAQVIAWQNRADSLALVDFGGVRRTVSLQLLPEAASGDWVIVHAGFALARLNEAEAAASLAAHGELEASRDE
jgi:hydrogenase expression/formation protein HypC